MSEQERLIPEPGRAEKSRGRLLRWIGLGAATVLLVLNAGRIGGPVWWIIAIQAGAIAVGLAFGRYASGNLKRIRSREELSEAVSSAGGMRRINLVWYEYVIARNTVRGTYCGEPPVDFRDDVSEAVMNMSFSTRYAKRQMVWTFALIALILVAVAVPFGWGDPETMLVLAILFSFVMLVSVGSTLLFTWIKNRTPRAKLGRRIEEASVLETEARWAALLSIAREELGRVSAT